MNTPVDAIAHVRTDANPADIGTRPEKLEESHVGPDSIWENGHDWMKKSLNEAIKEGIVTPSSKLTLKKEDESEFDKGIILERMPEILVRGHSSFASEQTVRTDKMAARGSFSNYIISPLKLPFPKCIRVTAHCFRMFKMKRKCDKTYPNNNFKMFMATKVEGDEGIVSLNDDDDQSSARISKESMFAFKNLLTFSADEEDSQGQFKLNEDDLSDALTYWFLKGTAEVKQFCKKDYIEKIAVEKQNILYNRCRIMDGQRLINSGEFDMDRFNFKALNLMTPVLEKHSPIALSFALYVHEV